MVFIKHPGTGRGGYLKLTFTGSEKIRFLNLCRNHHLNIWEIKNLPDNSLSFFSSINSFYRMKHLRQKCGGCLTITEKKGIVFQMRRLRKRILFLIGTILFLLLLKMISLYVWNISFEGNYSYTDQELLKFLYQHQIHQGVKKSSLNYESVEFLLRKEFEDITWVSAELKGTCLIIHIKENFDKKVVEEETSPYHLVSNVTGIIDTVITRHGVPLIKTGDSVEPGQKLISGILELKNDSGDVTGYEYVKADADIYALVKEDYDVSFSLNYFQKHYTGNAKKAFEIDFFGKQASITLPGKHLKKCDVLRDYDQLSLTKNFFLPITFGRLTFREYETEKRKYSKEEAMTLAKQKLDGDIQKFEEKGIQIIENNVTIEINDSTCRLNGQLLCRKKIGKPEWILVNDQNENRE